MKLIFSSIIMLCLMLYGGIIHCQPPGNPWTWANDVDHSYLNRDHTVFIHQDFGNYIYPCNCEDIIKPAQKKSPTQPDNVIDLIGGKKLINNSTFWGGCQEIDINICACRLGDISGITICPENIHCPEATYRLATMNDDGTADVGNPFIPATLNTPPANCPQLQFPTIPQGQCREIKFWICSQFITCNGGQDITVDIYTFMDCSMVQYHWIFDQYYTEVEPMISQNISNFMNLMVENQIFDKNLNYSYRVLNLLKDEVKTGFLNSISEYKYIKNNLNLQSGLYIIQLIQNAFFSINYLYPFL